MNEWLPVIEQALKKYLYVPEMPYRSVAEAMAYSAEAGGKRLRPMLVLEFCRLVDVYKRQLLNMRKPDSLPTVRFSILRFPP